MTEPASSELRNELDAEAVRFEEMVTAAVTAGFVQEVTEVVQQWLAAVTQAMAGATELVADAVRRLRDVLIGLIDRLRPQMSERLRELADRGVGLGVDMASRLRGETIRVIDQGVTDSELVRVIGTIDYRAQIRLDEARRLARTSRLSTLGDAAKLSNSVTAAANGAKADAAWCANRSIGEGVTRATVQVGGKLLWVAERNACLHCLALSGHVVEPGELFPNLTFSDRPLSLPAVPYPPRHPWCRCRAELYTGPAGTQDRSDPSPATALQREAQRSVARGLTDYASNPAKLRAADRLIRRGAFLPPTVIARAARDVKRGRFTARPKV